MRSPSDFSVSAAPPTAPSRITAATSTPSLWRANSEQGVANRDGGALLLATRYSLFAIRYSPFVIRYSLFAIRYSPFAIRYFSFPSPPPCASVSATLRRRDQRAPRSVRHWARGCAPAPRL